MSKSKKAPKEILAELVEIKPGNSFLHYIAERVQDDAYRGIHVSQHNRYGFDRLNEMLKCIYGIVGNQRFRLPLGDDDGSRKKGYEDYYKIVEIVKIRTKIGTINSVKKNFFVDFQKMGLLDRFGKEGEVIEGRSSVHSAKLTEKSIALLNSSTIMERHKLFTEALDIMLADAIVQLAQTLYYSKYKNEAIDVYEFMLILTDNREGFQDKKISLIDAYRSLKPLQQKKAIDLVKLYCNPKNFSGNKTMQRDFGNWKNQTQQIFSLLRNTVYFSIANNQLILNTGTHGVFDAQQLKKRSSSAKKEYFIQHNIIKMASFELDHVVPFASARNKFELKLIDNWLNMIYLAKSKHKEKTKKNNRNMLMSVTGREVYFDDESGDRIVATNGKTAQYSEKLTDRMQKHNRKILKKVFDWTIKTRLF